MQHGFDDVDDGQTAEISRQSLAEQVSEALVAHIVKEGLGEGEPLPSTAELAERYRVSRTVVREAIAALAGRGILTRSQGRESVVSTPGPTDISRVLSFRIRRDGVSLRNVLDSRYGLEITAARLAASNASTEDLERVRQRMSDLESKTTDSDLSDSDFSQADIDLHRAIAIASHNPLILLLLDSLSQFLLDFRVEVVGRRKARGETLKPVVAEHQRIVDAILSRDVDRSGEAMRAHLEHSLALLD